MHRMHRMHRMRLKVGLYVTSEAYSPEQLWQLLQGYDQSHALLAASISSQNGMRARTSTHARTHARTRKR